MFNRILIPAAIILALSGCETQTAGVSSSSANRTMSGAEIASAVDGRTFSVRTISGPSAGTVGQATYNLQDQSLAGSFRTPSGETGTYTIPARIQGDRLCQGEGSSEECYRVVAEDNGFAKLTDTGEVQARWTPITPAASTTSVSVPQGSPVSGAQIRSLVEGGPYDLRIFDGDFAGTQGRTTWNFDAMRITGSFRTASGETGNIDMPITIEGNQLCAGEGDGKACHVVYPYQGGFMEVTADGQLHAVSTPA